MNGHVIIDTGPLVASLVIDEQAHGWACDILGRLPAPMLTCEAVLVESAYLLELQVADGQRSAIRVIRGSISFFAAFAPFCE